ncbi:hypothetical protein Rsub_04504 [Raphidocelis subcapitata]|uniref:Uncharacterized protein n=1 Tax=Raphidocelis subcapitata TaxID=307507 RepID=A0A2V0P4P0_9CHLO|nr:hypothetical protein Rsub_04504 [Raphidocelis subcapitata]|eukprot:GBF92157.1 hypothetical protein Rsub_04504 [Raphidocelis subcapitata]
MFQAAVHEALKKQTALKAEADACFASAADNAAKLSDVLAESLNEEVREIYETQKLLETESQLLRRELAESRAALSGWAAKLQRLQGAVKEAGDLEHYSEYLAREAAALARAAGALGLCAAAPAGGGTAAEEGGAEGEVGGRASGSGGGGGGEVGEALPISRGASR